MRIAGFEFAEGARFQAGAKGDPNVVGKHLEMLREQCKGELTPDIVVYDARHDNSPLHSFFEWDDGEAAHQHRLSQARGLIRSVVAVYVRDDKPAIRHKAYVHVSEAGTPHYREASHALSLKKTREMVLQKALSELQSWRRRYADLQEFADVVVQIDDTVRQLQKAD